VAIGDRLAQFRGNFSGKADAPKPHAPRERVTPWQYLKEVREELGKVTWPSRQDVVQGTIRVIVVSLIFAAVLGAADFAAQRGLNQLIERTPAPAADTSTPEATSTETLPVTTPATTTEIPATPAAQ